MPTAPHIHAIARLSDQKHSTRQVKEFGFDLVLEVSGESKSPLKALKSGRAQKTPQRDLPPQKSSRRTPRVVRAPASSNVETTVEEEQGAQPNAAAGIEGEEDILRAELPAEHDDRITAKKRKLGKEVGSEQAAKKRKPKPVQKARSQKPKPTSVAPSHEVLGDVEDVPRNKSAIGDGLRSDTGQAEAPEPSIKGRKYCAKSDKAAIVRSAQGEVASLDTNTEKKPVRRKGDQKADISEVALDKGSSSQQEHAVKERTPVTAPVRKRKKRKSIGQQPTKRAKKPSNDTRQETLTSKPDHEISDLVNELLDSMIEVGPKESVRDIFPHRKSVKGSEAQSVNEARCFTASAPDEACEHQAPSVVDGFNARLEPDTPPIQQQTKRKPRKKRRSITQVIKRPKRQAAAHAAQEADSTQEPDVDADAEPKSNAIPSPKAAVRTRVGRGRKPLSNITNLTPDIAMAPANPAPAEESGQAPVQPKKRGRPRMTPAADTSNTSESRNDITEPALNPIPLAASSLKPKAAPRKKAKASTKPRMTPRDPTPVAPHLPANSLPDDPDLDSDDPLSGAAPLRLKKTTKSINMPAQGPSETLEQSRSEPSTENTEPRAKSRKTSREARASKKGANASQMRQQELTPHQSGSEDQKRREAEHKEIEGLLGSIKKAVKRGRAMAAGGV